MLLMGIHYPYAHLAFFLLPVGFLTRAFFDVATFVGLLGFFTVALALTTCVLFTWANASFTALSLAFVCLEYAS